MNKMEQSVKQSAKKMINHMLEREYLGWPRLCGLLLSAQKTRCTRTAEKCQEMMRHRHKKQETDFKTDEIIKERNLL